MKEEILLNVTPREVRAALLENGVLHEVYIERAGRRGLISNVYKGRVSRVLPGMQAAFVDIGLERTAFLHVSDIAHAAPVENGIESPRPGNIRELVSEGGEILVQVLKDPLIIEYMDVQLIGSGVILHVVFKSYPENRLQTGRHGQFGG